MSPVDPLLDWLISLEGPKERWDFDTAATLDRRLGCPHRRYHSVHVAGTNGKGSVAALLHALCLASGVPAGLFTSPHLVRPEERIRLGEHDIAENSFRELIEALRALVRTELSAGELLRHPSFFEMLTAAALLAFAREELPIAIIETGLGGRLDATNVITPLLSIITTIGLDHQAVLGATPAAIAREKAGIIKPGVPVLAGWIEGEALDVLRDTAHRRGAPFHLAAQELELREHKSGRFDVVTPHSIHRELESGLTGPHQRRNAALALRAAELVRVRGVPLDESRWDDGLRSVRWRGRCESIEGAPRLLLDTAHNIPGVMALAAALEERDSSLGRPSRRVLIFGISEGRDAAAMLPALAPYVDEVLLTSAGGPKAVDGADLSTSLRGIPHESPGALPATLERARALAGADGEILVTGSLFLVGDTLEAVSGRAAPLARPAERLPAQDATPRPPSQPGSAHGND